MKKNEEHKGNRRQIVAAGFVYAACFCAVILILFLMFLANASSDWMESIVRNIDAEVSLVMSLFFLFTVSFLFFYYEDRDFLRKKSNILLFYILIVMCAVLCWVFGRYVHLYIRPYALFSMLCLFALGRRHAIFLNFIFVLVLFSLDLFSRGFSQNIDINTYATLLIGFMSGTFAVFVCGKVKNRIGILGAGFLIAILTALVVVFFKLPIMHTAGWIDYVSSVGFRILGSLISAGLALTLLPLIEVMFGLLTPFRLRELTSTDAPLLSRLQQEAPGTFNHSLIVAQLSETCAVAIGENAELARAAAYYHDVGKLKQPDCFTENQTGYNVHDELAPELSADIIRSHARDGYELLVQSHLPKEISEVALEHHGTLPIKFFYEKALRLTGGEANLRDFSYFGPVPQTRISAIVMIADGAEAATRALTDRSPENVERVVRGIIEERMDLDQFAQCDITMKQLTIIKQALVDALSSVHHHRVEYPEIRFNRNRQVSESDE